MKAPVVLNVAIWAQMLPVLGYAGAKFKTRPAAALVLGSLVSVLANVIGYILRDLLHNNQIASYISSPVTAACWLAALAEWQSTVRERTIMRRAIIPFFVLWIVLVALVEDVAGFDVVTAPLYSLAIMIAALWTLLRRATGSLHTAFEAADWFWASAALALNGAITGLAAPVGGFLYASGRIDLFALVWTTRAWAVILSMVLLTWGIFKGPVLSHSLTPDVVDPSRTKTTTPPPYQR